MDVSNSGNIAIKGDGDKEQCSGKSTDQPCEPTRSDSSGVSSSVVDDEEAVLGDDETAKEYDVNLDEDELLKDTDTDANNANSEYIQTETSSKKHSENNEVNFQIRLTNENQPSDVLSSIVKDSTIDNAEHTIINCNSDSNELSLESNTKKLMVEGISSTNSDIEVIEKVPKEHKTDEIVHSSSDMNVLYCGDKVDMIHEKELTSSCDQSESRKNNKPDTLNTNESTDGNNSPSSSGVEESKTSEESRSSLGLSENSKNNITDELNTNELKDGNKSDSAMEHEKSSNKESSEEAHSSNDGGTTFLHVEQDNSRTEESYLANEAGGEDPFAQTCDEVMDTTENSDKDNEPGKGDTSQENTPMDVEKIPSECSSQKSDRQVETTESVQGTTAKEPMECSNTEIINDHATEKNVQILVNSHEKDSAILSVDVESEGQLKKSDDTCKSSETDPKQIEISSHKEPCQVNTILPKSKTAQSSSKSKKGKRDTSEEDSDDSDFEINPVTVIRPKRTAAKKAESQIKVLRAAEEAVDIEDGDANGVEERRASSVEAVDDSNEPMEIQTCHTCKKAKPCEINILCYGRTDYFCDEKCFATYRDGPQSKPGEGAEIVPPSTVIKEIRSADIQPISRVAFIRKCSQCSSVVKSDNEKTLSWETMDYCSEECLGKYQQELGSHCANCKGNVQPASLGKYCVRFGYEVKQFCCSSCLEEFKKGLKVCSFCQKDISSGVEGFLAPVGDKGTFKDFCTQACMEKYEQMSSNQPPPPQTHACHVCNNVRLVEIEVFFESKVYKLCSDICFTAYKFANKLNVDRCDMCKKYFDKDAIGEKFNIFYEEVPHNFCCKTCMNVYILAKRKIVPCNWCKVKKYNFDMIKRVLQSGQVLMMCSLNCMTLYQVSVNAVSSRRIKCDMCMAVAQAQYHLTMSDATIRNFCTYPCVMNFQQQYSKSPITLPGSDDAPIPTGGPVPVISSVTSLTNGQPPVTSAKVSSGKLTLLTRLQEPPSCHNKNTQTRPVMTTKSVSCRPHSASVHTQTDEFKGTPVIIPIPVPIYVPCPMAMYSLPYPVPVPFPLPIPVPFFLPTTRNSIKGIMKEIKRIQEKVPTDPLEAELLMMAEMVAADKKEEATSSESEADNEPAEVSRPNSEGEEDFNSEPTENSNTFGVDIMQMALNIAELDPPDLETQLTPATIVNQPQSENNEGKENSVDTANKSNIEEKRGRKRSVKESNNRRNKGSDAKRKKTNITAELPKTPVLVDEVKPDANMKLKYTFGVNAWKSWVTQKNVEIENLSNANKKLKPLKTDILQLTVDELNFSLCMFVKEVQKPNGTKYAPDTIYYLCLGIQQYLYENGRIDNIFTDAYFEPFTDALDEIAKQFAQLYNDHHYIVTRVEEEHLWESKQLGAHSPHVLLSTLLFLNTKYFNLVNVDEHMLLSFSHIMKHWKRNTNQAPTGASGKAPGSRNVLLRFYPPQAVLDDPNSKKKRVYEQLENEDNLLRCPVKLYEFYLSKCPESVKTRSDVFYLQPERSCVPDSPVWYSTMALAREPLEKMLNRVKMVKEINVALLNS